MVATVPILESIRVIFHPYVPLLFSSFLLSGCSLYLVGLGRLVICVQRTESGTGRTERHRRGKDKRVERVEKQRVFPPFSLCGLCLCVTFYLILSAI